MFPRVPRWDRSSTARPASGCCAGCSPRTTRPTRDVIFDTSRAWTAKLPALTTLFPDAKIICCVSNVAWIMDSIERQFRQNGFENTKLFAPAERSTVYTRVEALAHANRMVGFPWHAL